MNSFIIIENQVISSARRGIIIEPIAVAIQRGIVTTRIRPFDFGPRRNMEIIGKLQNGQLTPAKLLDMIDDIAF